MKFIISIILVASIFSCSAEQKTGRELNRELNLAQKYMKKGFNEPDKQKARTYFDEAEKHLKIADSLNKL